MIMDIHEGPHGRFKVIDHLAFGKLIHKWANDASTAPKSIGELKEALEPGIALVPTRYKEMRTVQPKEEEFILRLPPKHMINNTVEELSGPASDPKSTYAVPDFYFLKMRSGDGAPAAVSNDYINNGDFFFSRVADYTISVCR